MIGQTVIAVVFGLARAARRCSRTSRGEHAGVARTSPSSATSSGDAARRSLVVVLIWLIVAGTSNAVNLTDGLDGLATGA